jgi:hypothetical protein
MAYNKSRTFNSMEIIETSIFTRQIQVLLKDEEYRQLQLALLSQPDLGPVIAGSGGLPNVRWLGKGH